MVDRPRSDAYVLFGFVLSVLAQWMPASAENADDSLLVYAVNINRTPKQSLAAFLAPLSSLGTSVVLIRTASTSSTGEKRWFSRAMRSMAERSRSCGSSTRASSLRPCETSVCSRTVKRRGAARRSARQPSDEDCWRGHTWALFHYHFMPLSS
jgi:hypothetical protein